MGAQTAQRHETRSLPMRILFVCNPLHGHLNPLLPLARAAQDAGHAVVVATGADIAPLAQREGLSTWSVGMTHAQAGGNTQASWLAYFEAGARARIAHLAPRCAEWRPELVIHEETELAGPVVAVSLGVRSVVLGLGPMFPPRLLPWVDAAFESLAPRGSASEAVEAWRGATYLHLCPAGLAPAEEPIWRDVLPMQPKTPGGAGEPALMRRIEDLPHARTVFVTLGTVYGGHTAALVAAIEGLQSLAVNLIVAVGPQGDPSLFEGYGKHVLIERLVSLSSVLARCDAVVSQGGSGVMLAALAHGLPQLMLPQGADQFRNAEIGTRTGAALALAPQDATPDAISDGVHRLLNEGCFGSAAQVLRDQIAAMPDADTVIAALTADRRTAVWG
jgi:UDP:flavonoid glycosyltransferase YjiC (YdhE family)